MNGYCKHCHQTHAAWNRLNDGAICGLCGARERDFRVLPHNAQASHQTDARLTVTQRHRRVSY